MKSNRILIIGIVLLVAVLGYMYMQNGRTTLGGDLKNFTVEDTASVDRIFIADKQNHKVLLERKGPALWSVDGKYNARQDGIKMLLETLNKMVVRNPVAKSMEQKVLKDLAGPSQRKVEIYQKGELTKVFFMAAETPDKMATYMLMDGAESPYEIHIPGLKGFLQTRFNSDGRLWRDPVIFRYDYRDMRSVEVKYPSMPQDGFTVKYDGKITSLYHPGNPIPDPALDSLRAFEYLNSFRNIGYEFEVVETFSKTIKDSILASSPFIEVSVTDKNGSINSMKGYRRPTSLVSEVAEGEEKPPFDVDRMYGMINNGKDFVLIQYYQFDKVIKPVGWFLRR
jgi:hypothetical protein